jgi:hypothetical protein
MQLAKKCEKKQQSFLRKSDAVHRELTSFDAQTELELQKVDLAFEDLQFGYDEAIKTKTEAWDRNCNNKKGYKNARSDMKAMERQARAIENFTKNANLSRPRWFPSFSKTIKEVISRAAVRILLYYCSSFLFLFVMRLSLSLSISMNVCLHSLMQHDF